MELVNSLLKKIWFPLQLTLRNSSDPRRFFIWLFGVVIVPLILIPVFFKLYVDPSIMRDRDVQAKLNQLKEKLIVLSFNDAESFRFCQELKKNETARSQLMSINDKRDQIFLDFINDTINLYEEGIISKQAYRDFKDFALWNNQLYFANKHLCDLNLKNDLELKIWRKKLLMDIGI